MTINTDNLTAFRRELHAHPEISGEEKETAARVLKFLKACKPNNLITEIGGYGIVATWDSGAKGKEVLF